MKQKLQHKYALSEQGAKDMIKAFWACTLAYLVLMFPAGMLYSFIRDLMNGTPFTGGRVAFYICGIIVCLALVWLTTLFQYNATFFATYKESGVYLWRSTCESCLCPSSAGATLRISRTPSWTTAQG